MIRGFWHICLINHWYTVVSEQMRILVSSGLYDKCAEILIGCLGSRQQEEWLRELITQQYSKLQIAYYSPNIKECEFPTIRLIEQTRGDYVGFYFHTKAVTKPTDTPINHWRECMNEFVLNRWRDHWLNVSTGVYDLSGMNFLNNPDHFSGNFWWFRRDYIESLPKVSTLNQKDRWQAEQWICMNPKKRVFALPFKEPILNHFSIQKNEV